MSNEDNRLLMHAQLSLVKEFVKQMNVIREEYVKRGLDKERNFLDEFQIKRA